jgi:purine nucleosidase
MFIHTPFIHARRVGRSLRHWSILKVLLLLLVICALLFPLGAAQAERPTIKLLIDTDPGVDDAAAIVWLLSQQGYPVEVLGITTVVGNATVENTTNNVLTLLDALERDDIPVVIGAAEPLSQPNSHVSSLLHGPDGLWFVGLQNPHDLSELPQDVPGFYCNMANEHPDAVILALAPLTNLAQAVQQCPEAMRSFSQIFSVGGSKISNPPLTDYNFWQDPEAAQIVLAAGVPITLITLEGRTEFTLTEKNLQDLGRKGNEATQLIVGPMQLYSAALTGFGGETAAAYDDVPAAILALDPSLSTAQSALVKMVTEQSLARGQTIIGLTFGERISMIASDAELSALADQAFSDPNFDLFAALTEILAREPDNGFVVLDVKEEKMHRIFMQGMTEKGKKKGKED